MVKTPVVPKKTKELLKFNLVVIGSLLAVMWGIEILDAIVGQTIDDHGIHPRDGVGLLGLVTSPFLHADFNHLIANSVPFAVLGFFVILRGMDTFIKVSVVTALAGGLMVWLVGASNSNHVGASGVIFGYFGYLLAVGFFERSFKAIAAAVVVGLMYGGMIFGVFPGQEGISWEGHLFGFLAGAAFAYATSAKARAAKQAKKTA